jgi:hypothetical protein
MKRTLILCWTDLCKEKFDEAEDNEVEDIDLADTGNLSTRGANVDGAARHSDRDMIYDTASKYTGLSAPGSACVLRF